MKLINFFINIWNAQKNARKAERMQKASKYWYERAVELAALKSYWHDAYKKKMSNSTNTNVN